ncbi:SOS response-associated peptidase [Luteithermobacter gelatinilyticus]|uniref:SOS response-associated peptidase n=1 Tax=Luteithermobacter gelatinilyticus TaxID=2582913 RepID=UPI001106D2D4|nr:SOS response-associated peptidase [Luteithermobacter gelatinilyticus]
MCGRYALSSESYRKFLEFLKLGQSFPLPSRFNIAPLQPVAVIRLKGADRDQPILPDAPLPEKEAALMRWGLVPGWAKELKQGRLLINARRETIADKPSFRGPFRRRRCLVPADGYYEWRNTGATRTPYFIHLPDREVFAFAGIWDVWMGPHGEDWLETVSIVTRPSHGILKQLHPRMPVVLAPEDYDLWLRPSDPPDREIFARLSPIREERLMAYEVSRYVNNVRHEGPGCIAPVGTVERSESQLDLFSGGRR